MGFGERLNQILEDIDAWAESNKLPTIILQLIALPGYIAAPLIALLAAMRYDWIGD